MTSNKAKSVLREIERTAETEFLPIIGPQRGRILVEVIRATGPKRILEIGTNVGYSAILMGKELGSDARITTIEEHADEATKAKKLIKEAGIAPAVEVLFSDAIRVLPKLEGKFDLVFIDADKERYLDYLRLIEDKLHKGSVVVADNAGIYANQMRDYLDYVRRSGRYRSECVPADGDALEISVKL
jgi:predicted O-methyltransferase YrrM